MYCNCILDKNYEVVGLCDVSKIPKITKKESWVEISVPEILTIAKSKPDIETIDKIYINAKVVLKRVIVTPPDPPVSIDNVEGTYLTGRKLAIDGIICQTIVYTANNCEQSVHSADFNMPFSTFIVLPKNTDVDLDQFCVDICIEDVFAKVLNPRKIFKNVTMFLRAKKIELVC